MTRVRTTFLGIAPDDLSGPCLQFQKNGTHPHDNNGLTKRGGMANIGIQEKEYLSPAPRMYVPFAATVPI